MSNYVKSVDFAVKDALTTGDPAKKTKGTEVDTEFNNIATAIATKANSNGDNATGTWSIDVNGNAATATKLNNWVVAGGTADAITATYAPAITTLEDGQLCFFRATAANATTTPSFSPNGLTARTITMKGGAAVHVGAIPAALAEVILRYNLANTRWELLNPAAIEPVKILSYNGGMRVKNGANATLTASYLYGTVDGYVVAAIGGTGVSGTITDTTMASAQTGLGLALSSVSWTTGKMSVGQRLEAKDCLQYNGKTVSVQWRVSHGFGSATNFRVGVYKANAADDFSAITLIGYGASVSVPNGVATVVSGSVTLGASDATNGLFAVLETESTNTVASVNVDIGDFMLEMGTVATQWQEADIATTIAKCYRYRPVFQSTGTVDHVGSGYTSSTSAGIIFFDFLVEPRVTPTGITVSSVTHFTFQSSATTSSEATVITLLNGSRKRVALSLTGTGTPYTANHPAFVYAKSTSGKITFTGATL